MNDPNGGVMSVLANPALNSTADKAAHATAVANINILFFIFLSFHMLDQKKT